MIRATIKITPNLKRWLKGNPERMTNIRRVVGRTVAARIKKEVLKRIPDDGGWFDIYRDAIVWQESAKGDKWAVAGLTDVELRQLPAEETLIEFRGGDLAAQVLAQYNPWTVDTIPAVDGGVSTDLIARPASQGEIEARRMALRELREEVIEKLGLAGASASLHDRPVINGRVQADLIFLAKRLEYGLGGFPKSPHWNPTAQRARTDAETWVTRDNEAMKELEKAGTDKPISTAPIMDRDLIMKVVRSYGR